MFHYIKIFLKSIRKNRFFYSINLIGFLTGFLLLTIIFSYVYQEFSFDRFHKNSSVIYRIHIGGYGVTPLCFKEKLTNKIPEITHIIRFSRNDLTLVDKGLEIKIGKSYYTDPDIFQVFYFHLLSGDANKVLKAPFSIVIDRSTAGKLYGKKNPIGETMHIKNGVTYTITGVMENIPYNSHIQANAFTSIETLNFIKDESELNCGAWGSLTYISLNEKSNLKVTENKLNVVLKDNKMGTMQNLPFQLQPIKDIYFDYANNKFDGSVHGNKQTTFLYLAISILILCIVMINFINLSTAISGSRIKEIAIRKINGAGTIQIIKQILLESLCFIFISFNLTLLLIELLLPKLSNLLNITISASHDRFKYYVYYFVGFVIIGFLTALIPGVFLAKINEAKAIKNESLFKSRGIQRKVLLVLQVVIVAILLNATFLINKQINFMLTKDLGFHSENVITIYLNEKLIKNKSTLKNKLLQDPQIKSISFSDELIGKFLPKGSYSFNGIEKLCNFCVIDPSYLPLMDIKMKYGRNFNSELPTDTSRTFIINEKACSEFGIENPVNKFIYKNEIIGVVKDFNFTSLHDKIEPLIIKCSTNGKVAHVKLCSTNPEGTIAFIKNTCISLSPDFIWNYSFLDDQIKLLYKSEFGLKRSFIVYTIIAFVIALLGLFGLTLFMIRKKIKEVSLRKLYGATFLDTCKLLTKEQIWIVVISNLMALPISLLLINKWLNNFQYKADIGFLIFFKTFIITIMITLSAIFLLINQTRKTKMTDTFQHE